MSQTPTPSVVRWVVTGRVQGVGYRWHVLREAERIAVAGWVRNLSDGRVEVVARGSPDQLQELEAALKGGSPIVGVENVEISYVPHEDIDANTFYIK